MNKISYHILFTCLILCSCSASRMVETDLYFAQSRPDGSILTEAEWKGFKENQIDKVFTEGSTLIKVTGNWFDPVSHQLISEPTYLIVYFYKRSPRKSKQIDSLVYRYKSMFDQQSVLRVDKKVKASF